ncbi:hypothetical protein C8J56DRAFT_796872 [Mycena floridula]|nr:hypothetical protein C8J56DRAFT_796872 [Mycena floridula]
MQLLKASMILLSAWAMRVSSTPPNPRNKSGSSTGPIIPDWRESFLRALAWPCVSLRTLTWFAYLGEVLVILALHNPSGPISSRILSLAALHGYRLENIRLTPSFIVGTLLTLLGATLRMFCYRTLGLLFTFELSISSNHRLITDGPYAWARHPSYTGMILTIIGTACNHGAGSWIVESGLLKSPVGRLSAFYWLGVAGSVIISLLLRLQNEDELLKREFGATWIEWQQKVKWALIPGIF